LAASAEQNVLDVHMKIRLVFLAISMGISSFLFATIWPDRYQADQPPTVDMRVDRKGDLQVASGMFCFIGGEDSSETEAVGSVMSLFTTIFLENFQVVYSRRNETDPFVLDVACMEKRNDKLFPNVYTKQMKEIVATWEVEKRTKSATKKAIERVLLAKSVQLLARISKNLEN
jgi:hypothetical protein